MTCGLPIKWRASSFRKRKRKVSGEQQLADGASCASGGFRTLRVCRAGDRSAFVCEETRGLNEARRRIKLHMTPPGQTAISRRARGAVS